VHALKKKLGNNYDVYFDWRIGASKYYQTIDSNQLFGNN